MTSTRSRLIIPRTRKLKALRRIFLFSLLLLSSVHGQNQSAFNPQPPRPRIRLPIFAFEPHAANPILSSQGSTWEAQAVTNAAALVKHDTLFLLYTAEDQIRFGTWNGTARIGLAFSTDGVNFTRAAEPVLQPTLDVETPGGCRDPRVIFADNVYYMTYSAFDFKTPRLALATSSNLREWKKHGLLLPDTGATKAGAMFPQKVNGRYVMYYGKQEEVRIAYSNDLVHWFPQAEPVLRPRYGKFDSEALEPGPPPVIIDSTIVLLYNARDLNGRSACGLVRFSLDNPTTVLARLDSPLFTPLSTSVKFEASGLIWFRGQYELFYNWTATTLGKAGGKLLYTESK